MAAIIAQLNRRSRERKKREKEGRNYASGKCVYELKPFDSHFDPKVHNPYIASREEWGIDEIEAQAEVMAREELSRNISSRAWPAVTLGRCVIETATMGGYRRLILIIKLPLNYSVPTWSCTGFVDLD